MNMGFERCVKKENDLLNVWFIFVGDKSKQGPVVQWIE